MTTSVQALLDYSDRGFNISQRPVYRVSQYTVHLRLVVVSAKKWEASK